MIKKRKEKHTFKFIVKTLLTLRDENYDISMIATNNRIPKHLLSAWADEFGEEIWNAHPIVIQNANAALASKMSRQHEEIRIKSEELATKLVDLLMDKLSEEELSGKTTIRDLTLLFKEVIPYILPKFVDETALVKNNMESTYENFIENMFNKLNDSNAIRRNQSEGATKKLSGRKK